VLRPGCVVEVFAAHINPPKRKFFVIASLELPVLGFFINSRINPYIARRRELANAQVQLLSADHSFLSRDSFLDCSDVHTFPLHFLEREVRTNPNALLGLLCPASQTNMLKVVAESYTLGAEQIARILKAFR
jgi:hypothetical protein